jgi:hypothetical protein
MSLNRKIFLLAVAAVAVLTVVLVVIVARMPVAAGPPEKAQQATNSTGSAGSRESRAIDAYSDWVAANPDLAVNGAGLRLDADMLVIQWKGQPPAELRQLLDAIGASFVLQEVPYSAADIAEAGRQLTETGLVPDGSIVQPEEDYSGIVVVLPAGVPSVNVELNTGTTGVPVRVVEGDQAILQTPGSSN